MYDYRKIRRKDSVRFMNPDEEFKDSTMQEVNRRHSDRREKQQDGSEFVLTSTVSTVTLTEISLPLTVSYERPFLVGRTESATTWYVRMAVRAGMSLRRAGCNREEKECEIGQR